MGAFFASHRLFLKLWAKPRLLKFESVPSVSTILLSSLVVLQILPVSPLTSYSTLCSVASPPPSLPPSFHFSPHEAVYGGHQRRSVADRRGESVYSFRWTYGSFTLLLQTQFGVLMQYRSAKTWIGPGRFWCLPKVVSPPQAECKANRREACPE